jgi:hypothetical protein
LDKPHWLHRAEHAVYFHRMKILGLAMVVLFAVLLCFGKIEAGIGFVAIYSFLQLIEQRKGGALASPAADLAALHGPVPGSVTAPIIPPIH